MNETESIRRMLGKALSEGKIDINYFNEQIAILLNKQKKQPYPKYSDNTPINTKGYPATRRRFE